MFYWASKYSILYSKLGSIKFEPLDLTYNDIKLNWSSEKFCKRLKYKLFKDISFSICSYICLTTVLARKTQITSPVRYQNKYRVDLCSFPPYIVCFKNYQCIIGYFKMFMNTGLFIECWMQTYFICFFVQYM